jgi:hypothetical protein
MRHSSIVTGCLMGTLVLASQCFAQSASAPASTPARHPFTAKDWPTLRSAAAVSVSPEGLILYGVAFGADKGPSHHEWWITTSDCRCAPARPGAPGPSLLGTGES